MWGVIWTAVVSELWKQRNNAIFKGRVVDGLEVVALVQVKAWSWTTSKSLSGFFSFFDWCLTFGMYDEGFLIYFFSLGACF